VGPNRETQGKRFLGKQSCLAYGSGKKNRVAARAAEGGFRWGGDPTKKHTKRRMRGGSVRVKTRRKRDGEPRSGGVPRSTGKAVVRNGAGRDPKGCKNAMTFLKRDRRDSGRKKQKKGDGGNTRSERKLPRKTVETGERRCCRQRKKNGKGQPQDKGREKSVQRNKQRQETVKSQQGGRPRSVVPQTKTGETPWAVGGS